jgi:hypothetical protein
LRANYTATQIIGQHNDEFNNSVNVVTNYGDEAILEVIWALQEACALIYPGQITKSCPQNYVYNNNDNSCVRNNGIWEPLP